MAPAFTYKYGAHEQTRTVDPLLTMEVLYQLSYAGLSAIVRVPCRDARPTYAVYSWSGKRDSNPRPSAWKADALAN